MRKLVEDTLMKLDPEVKFSENAVNLLLGTAAQESAYGKYHRQLGNGPALGIFQMEPATFKDIDKNYLRYHPEIKAKILSICRVTSLNPIDLLTNDQLAICMTRVHYLRCVGKMPDNVQGWAEYWKEHYNTVLGDGTVEEFLENYKRYVLKFED